jgi:tetratricopeptide (TPR) repeat protein
MSRHPSRLVLERFLRGELEAEERRSVVEHLLGGCRLCAQEMAPLAAVVLHPDRFPPVAGPDVEESYDGAIERALAAVRLHGERAPQVKREKAKALDALTRKGAKGLGRLKVGSAATIEAALARGRELRHTDPDQMVYLLGLAAFSAHFLEDEGYAPEQIADTQARTLGEYANALRIVHRYAEADRYLVTAFEQAQDGTGDPWLFARLIDLLGSLFGSKYKYANAVRAFGRLDKVYESLGDRHLAGRALINMGFYAGLGGFPEEALRLLEMGARKVDPAREPALVGIALHNRLLFLAECGEFRKALSLLIEQREILGKVGASKLLGIEGRIYAGLGHLDMAKAAFEEGKAQLLGAGDPAHAGLLALDLAALLLRQGRTSEGRAEAEQALSIYRDLQIEREARKALALLGDALRSELVTAAFVERVVDFLLRLEHRPWLRFNPAFE